MRRTAVDLVLVTCALLVTALVVRRELIGDAPPPPTQLAVAVDSPAQYDAVNRRDGAERPELVAIVLSDYECGFCAKLDLAWDSVRAGVYGERVARVVRHAPVEEVHPFARRAAIAAECARAQGRFDDMHRALMANWRNLSPPTLSSVIETVGVPDKIEFGRCISSPESHRMIEADLALVQKLGIAGTPVLILGDSAILGALSADELNRRIAAILAVKR